MKPLKQSRVLVVLVPGFPSNESDTTCLPSPQSFIRSLNHLFPELKIIILALEYPYRKDTYRWYGNTVISFNGKGMNKIQRPFLWLQATRQLRRLFSENHVIGILSFWCLEAALVGHLYARKNNIRHLIWMHGQDAKRNNRYFSLIKPSAEKLVAISPALAYMVESNHGVRPSHIVPNGIIPHEYVEQVRDIDILGVGSLIPLKQYDIFLQTVAAIKQLRPAIKALLVGAGPEEKNLRRSIATSGLQDTVTLTGELPHNNALEMMRRSKVFLHPSSYEGYSTVCLEALYAGCHVISFVAAEKQSIRHWHIVNSPSEMASRCADILTHEKDFSSVLVHDMNDTARHMMTLFNYPDETTS